MGEEAPEKRGVPGLGGRIREVVDRWAEGRGHRGLLAFSRKAGLSDTALAEYIREETTPSAYALWRIAEVADVSLDYLMRGGRGPRIMTPAQQATALLASLRALPQYRDLPRDYQRRYRDLLSYLGVQLRRIVFDAERALEEMHRRARDLHFDADEFRRGWLDSEQEGLDDE